MLEYLLEHRLLLAFVSVLVTLKIYYKLTTGRCHSKRRLDGKTVIVTGGNAGIGKETALDFARRGARVILACRNMTTAEAVRNEIIRETNNHDVEVRKLDLSSLDSVRNFAQGIVNTEPSLHILVNNAGMPGNNGKRSVDGLEMTMQINHLGHFLLTYLLLDLLRRSAPSRVVFVSSAMHKIARLDPDDLRHEKLVPFSHFVAYANTKLCNILTAAHLGRLLEGTGVVVNSVHPGTVLTDIWNKFPAWARPLIRFTIQTFMKTAEEGAQTTIYVAVSEEVEHITGKYFADCKVHSPTKEAEDEELAHRVWVRSCELLGIPFNIASRL